MGLQTSIWLWAALLLLMLLQTSSNAEIIYQEEQYFNVDAGFADNYYNVTSTFFKVNFTSNCVVEPSSSSSSSSKIGLVIWSEAAAAAGCYYIGQIIPPIQNFYDPWAVIVTSSFDNLTEHDVYNVYNEAFLSLIRRYAANITLATNQTAQQLLGLPPDSMITVTWSII